MSQLRKRNSIFFFLSRWWNHRVRVWITLLARCSWKVGQVLSSQFRVQCWKLQQWKWNRVWGSTQQDGSTGDLEGDKHSKDVKVGRRTRLIWGDRGPHGLKSALGCANGGMEEGEGGNCKKEKVREEWSAGERPAGSARRRRSTGGSEGGVRRATRRRGEGEEKDRPGTAVGGSKPPFSSPPFHSSRCPPGKRGEGPRAAESTAPGPAGRAAERGRGSARAGGRKSRTKRKEGKKGSGVVCGQGLIAARGKRSRAVPWRHFLPPSLPPSNPLRPPTWQRLLPAPGPPHSGASPPRGTAGTQGKEEGRTARLSPRLSRGRPAGWEMLSPGSRPREEGQEKMAGAPEGTPRLTSCSARCPASPGEERKWRTAEPPPPRRAMWWGGVLKGRASLCYSFPLPSRCR